MFNKKVYIVLLLVTAVCFAQTEDKSNKDKVDYVAKVFGASGALVKPSAQTDAEQKEDKKPRNSVLLKAAIIGGAVLVGATILLLMVRKLQSRRLAGIRETYSNPLFPRADGSSYGATTYTFSKR